MARLRFETLHARFLSALGDSVVSHSEIKERPLTVDLRSPLPHKIRLYIFTITNPRGGRTPDEHKIQLIIPGQKRGERANFDNSDGRITILAGLEPESGVFVLWDAGLYPDFSYSRNVQVKGGTIYGALAGKIKTQERRLRSQPKEVLVATPVSKLGEALQLRVQITRKRLLDPQTDV